ncbi:TRAM domain-containing protein, partial [Candidatus Saccharibacteria bacterium]|nr:TRAM domain-containing protein [Candidatus Saccharibacteria bacterium]
QKGSGRGQGVGYLEDGTMVVVDNAIRLIGKTVEVEVSRYHQTESGKMIFATQASAPHQKQANNK